MTLLKSAGRWLIVLALFGIAARQAQATSINYVIQISVDALRGDLLKNLVTNSPGTYPNFARLQAQSAYTYNARTDYDYTVTIPDHASMLTGRPVLNPAGGPNTVGHGYTNDFPTPTENLQTSGNLNVAYKASVFDVAHDNGLSTEMLASKTRFQIYDNSWNATSGALDVTGADNGRDKIDFTQLIDGGSASIVNTFVANMSTATPYQFTFLHLVEPDTAGHASDWGSAAWNTAVATVDSRLGQVFSLIDNNPTLAGHTAITLTADHGGGVPSKNHGNAAAPEDYTIPFFVWGAGLTAGSDLYSSFSNRFDPLSTRPTYTAAQQPIRNGDAGNISLRLLGLGPIPGSLMQPSFILPVFPGDANGDRTVNFSDLSILLLHYNHPGVFADGDFNNSGTVDFSDLSLLLLNYNQTVPLGASAAPVPEPSGLVLAGLAVCLFPCLGRRTRRSRAIA